MPRLTRTQKFADLRDSITNDSEQTLKTEENLEYDDRLSKLQGFSSIEKPEINQPVYQQPVIETPSFNEPINNVAPQNESPLDNLMSDVNDAFDNVASFSQPNTVETPSFNSDMFDSIFSSAPATEEVKSFGGTPLDFSILDNQEPVKETKSVEPQFDFDVLSNNIINDIRHSDETSIYEQVVEAPVEQPVIEEQPSFDEFESVFNQDLFEEETPVEEQSVIEEPTIEQPVVEEQPEFEEIPVETNDEEFSNTVSLEISKIMDDLSVVEEKEKSEELEVTKVIEKVEEVKPAVPAIDDKNAVEIKNISELDTVENTMSDTIPFVVENKEVEVDEEEEEGSNVILNIILIVLIIVLIAVLGLIVYYILKTKGIL